MRGARLTGAVAVLVVALLGCGDDGGADERADAPAATDAPAGTDAPDDPSAPADPSAPPEPAGECAGVLVLVASANAEWEEQGDIVGLTADGEVRHLTDDGGSYGSSFSPDGSQVVYASVGPGGEVADTTGPYGLDLWVVDADGSDPHRILDGVEDHQPAWSPTGELIAFTRAGDDVEPQPDRIHVVAPDGTGDRELVAHDGEEDDRNPAWSPDGERLAFVRYRYGGPDGPSSQVVVVAADGSDRQVVHESPAWVGRPAWSPDGTRLAFPDGETYQVGALTVLDLESGGVTTGPTTVDGIAWAPNGLLYGMAQPPAVADYGGEWRVAEIALDGDEVGPGRAVAALEPRYFLYTDYRVDVPACLAADAPALTSEADVPASLTITHPATGEEVQVLPREALPDLVRQNRSDVPDDFAEGAPSLLAYGDEATDAAVCSQLGAMPGEPVGEPDPGYVPPCRLEVPEGMLVWLVAVDGGLDMYDATTGRFLSGGGGPDLTLPDLPDLAPE